MSSRRTSSGAAARRKSVRFNPRGHSVRRIHTIAMPLGHAEEEIVINTTGLPIGLNTTFWYELGLAKPAGGVTAAAAATGRSVENVARESALRRARGRTRSRSLRTVAAKHPNTVYNAAAAQKAARRMARRQFLHELRRTRKKIIR